MFESFLALLRDGIEAALVVGLALSVLWQVARAQRMTAERVAVRVRNRASRPTL